MNPHLPAEELLLFHDVHRAHRSAILSALADQGLQDVGQPKILIVLGSLREGGATQRELAEAIHVSPATMAASLKSLESRGYVTKQSDAHDGRCKRVAITQKGIDAIQRCHAAFEKVDAQLYAGFSSDEVEGLKEAYRRMLSNLYAIGGTPCHHPLGKDEPK